MMFYQHGDVLIKKIEQMPEGAVEMQRGGRIVLAEGEATGHAHVIESDAAVVYDFGGVRYLFSPEPVWVVHEEHEKRELPSGLYEIGQVQEYDHLEEKIRIHTD